MRECNYSDYTVQFEVVDVLTKLSSSLTRVQAQKKKQHVELVGGFGATVRVDTNRYNPPRMTQTESGRASAAALPSSRRTIWRL